MEYAPDIQRSTGQMECRHHRPYFHLRPASESHSFFFNIFALILAKLLSTRIRVPNDQQNVYNRVRFLVKILK